MEGNPQESGAGELTRSLACRLHRITLQALLDRACRVFQALKKDTDLFTSTANNKKTVRIIQVNMESESKLLPVLREGVNLVKMIFFKKMKSHLSDKYSSEDPVYISRLTGALTVSLFGGNDNQEPFATFNRENSKRIEKELGCVAEELEDFRIPITDALRVQFLCDSLQGADSQYLLNRAKDLGILIEDRDVPLPKTFMEMVRRLGVAFNLLQPMDIGEEDNRKE